MDGKIEKLGDFDDDAALEEDWLDEEEDEAELDASKHFSVAIL